ncbi:Cse2p PWA37_000496 [Arxiozyma heterogenica]|uniref:Mediator of RNA polymerase II transcription subunit 9 n=1 Tax=Arxiozyma heterogenica TaxID=278026 RepID=A0AAN8A7P0_9SACH|nr:hypothetical protein RI543_003919 [Kazachstania heterogenica]
MAYNNQGLQAIQEILCPNNIAQDTEIKHESDNNSITEGSDKDQFTENNTQKIIKATNISSSTTNTEFIPQIFYGLHNIMKNPNISNQLETSTGVIRHKLRSSKQILMEHDDTRILLNKSIPTWENFIQLKERELAMKRNVLKNLSQKIKDMSETTTL